MIYCRFHSYLVKFIDPLLGASALISDTLFWQAFLFYGLVSGSVRGLGRYLMGALRDLAMIYPTNRCRNPWLVRKWEIHSTKAQRNQLETNTI